MASWYLICRDGREDSVLSNVALGLRLKEAGSDVAVLFTGEALKGVTGEVRAWPPLLKNRTAQVGIAREGKAMGWEVTADFDDRWVDTERFLKSAAAQGLSMLACPMWSKLLGVEDALPDYLQRVELDALLGDLRAAERVIGGF